jgi:hypothetical protein
LQKDMYVDGSAVEPSYGRSSSASRNCDIMPPRRSPVPLQQPMMSASMSTFCAPHCPGVIQKHTARLPCRARCSSQDEQAQGVALRRGCRLRQPPALRPVGVPCCQLREAAEDRALSQSLGEHTRCQRSDARELHRFSMLCI